MPYGSCYRGWAPELLWQRKLSRDKLTVSEIYHVHPSYVCVSACITFCMYHDHMRPCRARLCASMHMYVCVWYTHICNMCLCITVIHQQMYGVMGTCPQAGGRSQTHLRFISGMSLPAPHNTTDLLPLATNTPHPLSQTGSMTHNRKRRTPSGHPTRWEDPKTEHTLN